MKFYQKSVSCLDINKLIFEMKTITKLILFLFCAFSYAQTSVSGSVLDDSGQPLPGANVIVIGTTTGAVTDFDGKFTLNVDQAPPFSIQVSSVGFESVTKEVTTKSTNYRLCFI